MITHKDHTHNGLLSKEKSAFDRKFGFKKVKKLEDRFYRRKKNKFRKKNFQNFLDMSDKFHLCIYINEKKFICRI